MCNSFIIIIINYPVRRCYLKYNLKSMLNSDFFSPVGISLEETLWNSVRWREQLHFYTNNKRKIPYLPRGG